MNEWIETAQERAFLYSLLTIPFVTLPDAAFVERIRSEEFLALWEPLTGQDGDLGEGARLLIGFVRSTTDLPVPEVVQTLGLDRTQLYRGIMPGHGAPPPYEAVWADSCGIGGDVGAVLARLAGEYRQSGMAPSEEARERLDYIGMELDYLRRLVEQEEAAWGADAETARVRRGDFAVMLRWTAGAASVLYRKSTLLRPPPRPPRLTANLPRRILARQADFFAEHLGQWAHLFVETALPMSKCDFYRGHLTALRGFLREEADFFETARLP